MAWVVFLMVAAACLGGTYLWLHRPVAPLRERSGRETSDPRIAVLAYGRVAENGGAKDFGRGQVRDHLRALQREGFEPVSLQDLARFYLHGAELPPRSLLVTFDHGYLETYRTMDPLLRDLRWNAVMMLQPERQDNRDSWFLYWNRLRRMVDTRVWEIGILGTALHFTGGTGAPALPVAQETGVRRRAPRGSIAAYWSGSLELLQSRLPGPAVLALAVAVGADIPGVASPPGPSLCFFDDPCGVNDRDSDPLRLRRLRVDPAWSAEDLAGRLAASLSDPPREDRKDGAPVPQATLLTGSGEIIRGADGSWRIEGRPRADARIAGSFWVRGWSLEGEIEVGSGEFWVIQSAADSSGEAWRWGGGERGLFIERRLPEGAYESLAGFPAAVAGRRRHCFRLLRRGAGIWAEWDGRPLGGHPSYFPATWRGPVDLVVWGSRGAASATLRNLAFSPLDYRVEPIPADPSREEIQSLIAQAPAIAAISPVRWLLRGESLSPIPNNSDLQGILSRRYGWEILPALRIEGNGDPRSAPVRPVDEHLSELWQRIMDLAEQGGRTGLRVEWGEPAPPLREEWGRFLAGKESEFRRQGRSLIVPAGGDGS